MRIEIGFDAECRSSLEEMCERLDRAAQLLEETTHLQLEAKRLLLENSRLLRRLVGGRQTLHIADEGDERVSDDTDGD